LVCVLLGFNHPVFNVDERLSVSDVKDKQKSLGAFVIRSSDGFELFLSSSVPDLELDDTASSFECSYFEVNANGGEESLIEDVISEPEEKRGFADGGVADEEDFEDEVVILGGHLLFGLRINFEQMVSNINKGKHRKWPVCFKERFSDCNKGI
jgi:hypothetical protein